MKYISSCFVAASTMTFAMPTNPQIVHGDVHINGNIINCNSKAIINWESFSIDEGNFVKFDCPAVLNRVTGMSQSEILGAINSNGKVYLINPNGIIFGANSQINCTSFISSTFDISDENFLKDKDTFFGKSEAIIQHSGKIYTTQEREGRVYLIADQVGLTGDAVIDATPQGTILIGGDFQGKNSDIPNSRFTVVEKGVTLNANEGGKIIVWADGTTGCYGHLNARGAESGGDGGFIEVSGKMHLDYQAEACTLAPNGNDGMLFLDPHNITVSTAAQSANVVFGAGCGAMTYCIMPVAPTPSNILSSGAGSLATNLAAGNVTITTADTLGAFGDAGTITFLNDVIWVGAGSLTVNADQDIFVGSVIRTDGAGTITLNATRDIFVGDTATGVPSVNPAGSVVGSSAGAITLNAGRNIQVGDVSGTMFSQVGYNGAVNLSPFAPITLTAAGNNLSLNNTIQVLGGSTGAPGMSKAYGQVGHGNSFLGTAYTDSIGVISVTATSGGIVVHAGGSGANSDCFAQIGHGGVTTTFTRGVDAAITVDASGMGGAHPAGAVTVVGSTTQGAGSTGHLNYGKIGHGGAGEAVPATYLGMDGVITVTTGRGLFVDGGNGYRSWAQVGHGGDNLHIGNTGIGVKHGLIQITAGGNGAGTAVQVAGGPGGAAMGGPFGQAAAQIGHGGSGSVIQGFQNFFQGPIRGNIDISTSNNGGIVLRGANGVATSLECPAIIGHGGDAATVGIGGLGNGDWTGDINIVFAAPAGIISALAGDSPFNYVQIGHGGILSQPDFIQGNINIGSAAAPAAAIQLVSATGAIDNGTAAYAQIGHGGSAIILGLSAGSPAQPNTGKFIGDINIFSNGNITIDGSQSPLATNSTAGFSQIGHGGADIILSPTHAGLAFELRGDFAITTNAGGILLNGGNGQLLTGAFIGHGMPSTFNAIPLAINANVFGMNISSAGAVSLTGGTAIANGAPAIIGNGLDMFLGNPLYTFTGNQTINVSGSMLLQGGVGPFCESVISLRTPTGTQIILAGNTLSVLGGDGFASDAGIDCFGILQLVGSVNDLLVRGGTTIATSIGFIRDANVLGASGIASTTGNVHVRNGLFPLNAGLLQARNVPFPIFSGATLAVGAGGDVTIANDISTLPSPTNFILFEADVFSTGKGAFAIDSRHYNAFNNPVGAPIAGAIIVANGPVTIFSSPLFANGITPADFQVGDITDFSLFASLGLMPATVRSQLDNVTIDPFRDIYFTSNVIDGGLFAGKDVLVVAQNDINMKGAGLITGLGNVTLVVDNQAPTAPNIGPGAFNKDATSFVNAGNQLKIYSARQPLNNIAGILNGSVFVKGTQFINTPREQWGVYYPAGAFGGPNWTVFYKDLPPSPQKAIFQSQVALSQLFFQFNQYDKFLYYWSKVFDVSYDKYAYNIHERKKQWAFQLQPYHLFSSMKRQGPISSYDFAPDREYHLPPQWKADGKQYNEIFY